MSKLLAKRVSNYELFFDLAFVLAISQMTSAFHVEHIDLSELLAFVTTVLVMLNIWNNEAFYYNKYGDSRRIDIYSIIVLMLWVGNLSLSFNFDMEYLSNHRGNILAFNSFLVLSYLTIALQYFLKGRKLGFTADIKRQILLLLLYSIPLFPIAIGSLPYSNWVVPFYLVPVMLPLILPSNEKTLRINFPHALERNQLLTIITFGEGVIAIIKTYPLASRPLEGALFFFGMGMMFVFYMTQTFININHHQKVSVTRLFYAHTLIIMSLLFFTVAIEFIAEEHHHEIGLSLFILSLIGYYSGVLLTTYYNHDLYRLNRRTLLTYGIILAIASVLFYLVKEHLALLAAVLLITTYYTNRTAMVHRRKAREANNIPHPDPQQNLRDFS